MTDVTLSQIHQIEYRWDPSYDLSPAASSMTHEWMMWWDAQIRNWVRHPSVETPSESARYQILPRGVAALAWRYRDVEVTDADGGVRGRPLVSRVLVGAAETLSPDMAMILCRSGMPAAAGPRPGEVEPQSELPVLSAADLAAFASDTIARLDGEAAAQEDLCSVLAAAVADPDTPLAIGIGEPQILQPSAQGIQVLLLWGLWRISYPLLGARRRGWSFSTFEPPLGFVDPKSLPDILFRSARVTQAAPPAIPRKELKVFPGTTHVSAASPAYDELAAWLVAEYRELGGDELQRRIADVSEGTPADARLQAVYESLSVKRAPARPDPIELETLATATPAPGESAPQASGPRAPGPQASGPEPSEVTDPPAEEKPEYDEIAVPPYSMAELVDRLAVAADADLFESLLREAITAPLQPDEADRQRARAVFGDNNCLVPVFRRHRYDSHEYELSRIVYLIVIPDLDRPRVRDEIAAWAYRGESAVMAALLAAARYSGADALSIMKETLKPVLAELWLTDRSLLAYWSPGPASPPDATPWRGRTALHQPGT